MTKQSTPHTGLFHVGPLQVNAEVEHPDAFNRVSTLLSRYQIPYSHQGASLSLSVTSNAEPTPPAVQGSYFKGERFNVDRTGPVYRATSRAGLVCHFDEVTARVCIAIPPGTPNDEALTDLDKLIGLVLALSFLRLGWVGLHAGTVCSPQACALLCAPSRVGKSTFLASLLGRGLQTMGDDKIIVRADAHTPPLAAGLTPFAYLDSSALRWVPKAKGRTARASKSDDRRVLGIADIWSQGLIPSAHPTLVFSLSRTRGAGPIRVEPMDQVLTLTTLLRQAPLPTDPPHAREIVRVLSATAAHCRGYSVLIPTNTYDHPQATAAVEELLR